MKPDDVTEPRRVEGTDPVLERVYRRGYALRTRRRIYRATRTTALSLMVLSAGVLGVVKLGATPEPSQLTIAPPASESPASGQKAKAKASASARATSEPAATPTSAAKACVNSFDPACGAFYWMVKPRPNAPLRIAFNKTGDNPAGYEVTVVVTVSDADSPNVGAYQASQWGDGTTVPLIGTALCLEPDAAHGGWRPPPERQGSRSFTFKHVYTKPGTYRVTFGGWSSSGSPWADHCNAADPYRSEGRATVEIQIIDGDNRQSPSPSPSVSAT